MIPSILLYIWLEATRVGIDPQVALCVAQAESELNVNAVSPSGRYVGLWQWHIESWVQVREEMGLPTCDLRRDAWESTRTAMYAMSTGRAGWWSTYGRCQEKEVR